MALRPLTPGSGKPIPLPEEQEQEQEQEQPRVQERYALPVPTTESMDREQERLFKAVSPGITEYSGIEFGPSGTPAIGGDGAPATRKRRLRPLEPEPAPAIPEEEPSLWDKIIDFASRSAVEQVAGGAREYGQRMAMESATETGEKVRRVRALEDAPEGQAAYLGPTSVSDLIRNPFKYMNPARALVEVGLSSTKEGRDVLEKQLLEEMQADLDKAKQRGEGAEMRPFSPAVQQFLNEESPNSAWEDFMAAPATIIAELGFRSAPNMLPGLVAGTAGGAAAGPAGFAAGMGYGSGRVEYAATLLGELQKLKDIDIYNAEDLMKVLSNEELMNEIHQKATNRAVTVGGADTVAAGLAGTVLVRKVGGPILTSITESVAQLGSQAGLGGLGEALAMVQAGEAETFGEAITSREALAEGLGEGVTGPIDIAAATLSGARQARAERAGWTPVPETDIDPETGKPVLVPDTEVSDQVRQETQAPAFETTDGFSEAEKEGIKTVLDKSDAPPQQGDMFPPQEGQAAPPDTQPTETQPTPPAGEPPPPAAPPPAPPPPASTAVEKPQPEPVVTEAVGQPTVADQPTAEPVGDIQAQLNDMVQGNRDAVFLSPEQEQAPDTLPEGAIALPNFDGKGGTLIAKDEGVAQGATAAREAGVDMQEIIGTLTRAGKGKPETGVVVQLRDEQGNVAKESAVASMEEAQALQNEWGEGAVIVTPEETIARREEQIAAEEAAPVESPMIERKEFENSFRDLLKRVKRKGQPGVRKALRELGTAINAVFPDSKNLPSLKGTIGPPRFADYFASLDEEIIIDEVLPNLKEFLRAVVESPDAATAVQNINRLTDYVANSGAGVVSESAKTPYLRQAAAGVNLFDVFEAKRTDPSKIQKYKTVDKGKKSPTYGQVVERERNVSEENKLPKRAVAIDELATTVMSLAEKANELGISVAAEVNELARRAKQYREWSQVAKPRTLKGGAGSTVTPQKFSGKNLDEVGGKLRAYAQELIEKIADAEATEQAQQPAKQESKPASTAKQDKKSQGKVTLYRAEADDVKFSDVFDIEGLKEAGLYVEGMEGKQFWTTEQQYADYFKETYGKNATIKEIQVNKEDVKQYEVNPGEYVLPKDFDAAKAETKTPQGKKVAKEVKEKTQKRKESKALKEYNALRRRAKKLGVKSTGKKDELAARVAEAETKAATAEEKLEALEKETTELELAGKLTDEQWKKRQAEIRKLKIAIEEEADVSQEEAKAAAAEEAKAEKTVKVTKKGKPGKSEQIKQQPKFVQVEPDLTPMRGKTGRLFGEYMNVEGGTGVVDRALDAAQISKELAGIVKAVIKKADAKGQRDIIQAIKSYDGDPLTLAATVFEAVGGQLAPDVMQDLLKFAQQHQDNRLLGNDEKVIRASQEALAAEAEANGMSVEDYKTLLQETGQYSEEVEQAETPWSDPYYDMSTDEYENSQFLTANNLPKGAVDWGADIRRALIDPKNGLLGFLFNFTKKRGQPDPGPTTVNDLLEAIIKALPANNRYVPLARRLLQLDMQVPVHIFEDPLNVGGVQVLGAYTNGENFDPKGRAVRLYVGEDFDPAHIFATALHEIVHAATVVAYETDAGFRYEIDALYDKAVAAMDEQNPNWRETDIGNPLTYGVRNPIEFIAEAMTSPTFQKWLSRIPSDNNYVNTSLPGSMSGLMRSFVNTVKKFFGYSIRNSLLEDVIIVVDTLGFQTEEEIVQASEKLNRDLKRNGFRHRDSRQKNEVVGLSKFSPVATFERAINKVQARIDAATKRYTGKSYSVANEDKVAAIGEARRNLNTAATYLSDSVDAEQRGRMETVEDLRDRATEYIMKAHNGLQEALGKEFVVRVMEEDPVTNKVEEVKRYSFDDRAEASATFNRLRAEGKSLNANFRLTTDTTVAMAAPLRKQTPNEMLDAQRALNRNVKQVITNMGKVSEHAAAKGNLAFSNLDVIERNNRSLFDKASEALNKANALTAYYKARAAASVLARKYEKKAHQLLRKLQSVDNTTRSKMEIIMRAVTMANIDPTQPLNSQANKHLWTKGGKNQPPRIVKKYKDLAPKARQAWIDFEKANPKGAKLLKEMAALTQEIHDTKVKASLFALGEHFELPRSMINALQRANDSSDIDRIFNPDAVKVLKEKMESASPDQKKVLAKVLAEAEAHAEVARSAKKILHDSSIKGWYFPLRRYGDFVVSTDPETATEDAFVSFHNTQEEADRVAKEFNKLNPDVQAKVSLKIKSGAAQADVAAVMGDLQRKFKGDGNQATRDRLKAALAEVMASNAAYQSQLTRANIDGVAAVDMARGFEEYVHVSKYTIGDLLVSHKIADSINDMNDLQANAEGVTEDERIQIGRVVNEIKLRNEADALDRHVSRVQKAVGLVGFFNFLGAPSYWLLNATQTYTVTIPYLTAKYGVKAPAELAKAQAVVLQAVAKALASNDKSYEGFKAQLPPAAQKIVEALEAENVIQSTIAHEFGDMLSPNAMNKLRRHALGKPVARTAELAVSVMEKVPEAVEHYNRISTAIAAANLSGGDVTATIDAVQATQFNYDTGNRARLLKQLPGGGGRQLVTPIMMFKTYGIGIARLLYGSILDVVRKEGGRLEAAKLAVGLITSHTLFGGVAGGLMMAPVMAIQAIMNEMFREEGDEWDLEEATEEWGREIAGDTFATAVRRGIPAALLGVDMSRSINLGNLMWMSDDRLDPTKVGSLKEGIFNIVGGPISSYGVNAWSEGVRLIDEGGRNWPEFLEAAIPLKAYRGVSQAIRYNTKGIESRGQLEFVSPEEFSQVFQTLLGFQGTQKTEIQDRYYSDELRKQKRSDRKSQLIRWANDAINNNDAKALGKIMDDIESFNLSLDTDERSYRISPADRAKFRSRLRDRQREFNRKYRY